MLYSVKKIVIIGGGFAGAYAASHLEKKFKVTLIDTKDYFEFTPGILRTIVYPRHMKKVQVLHSQYLQKAEFIHGEVNDFNSKYVFVNNLSIPFDYLIVCSGSRYESPIKEKNIVLPNRAGVLQKANHDLERAQHVLIVGGGLVGVELAAEIIDFFPDKFVSIIHSKKVLIERSTVKAQKYAEDFLKKRKVEFFFDEKMIKQDGHTFLTNTGRKIHADLAFMCTGIIPNTKFFSNNFSFVLNEKKQVMVEKTLQMKESKNIFVIGDLNDIKEEKTAQSAEKQAEIVVRNIFALENKNKLTNYKPKAKIMVISLGRYFGILTYKKFTLTGIIPAFLKCFVELKTMIKYR